ncbi:MAG: hypothetical protein IID60_05895 [Proteobacteria bacterium]|nr:hypothetical protein [Pseudomonadota bacterium]
MTLYSVSGFSYIPPLLQDNLDRLTMHRFLLLLAFLALPVHAEQTETYDYFTANRSMISNGVQAVLMCNGLFTSERTLELVFKQELAYLREPVGTAEGGDYAVDWHRKAVSVGGADSSAVMRAAFRDGIGCIVMAPEQTFDDIDSLPILKTPPVDGDPNLAEICMPGRNPGVVATLIVEFNHAAPVPDISDVLTRWQQGHQRTGSAPRTLDTDRELMGAVEIQCYLLLSRRGRLTTQAHVQLRQDHLIDPGVNREPCRGGLCEIRGQSL